VPDDLDELVLRLLAYDAAERPDDLSTVARTLRGIATSPMAVATAPVAAIVPARDAEIQRSTPPIVGRTRRLDEERAPLAARSPQASKARRWRPKLVRVTAWLAFLGAFASAGAIVVPAMLGAAQPVQATAEPPARLPAPAGVTATTSCDGWLSTGTDISWEPVEGATGYEIWRRGSADDTFTRLEPVGADVTAVRDVDLGVDMTYTYRVRAVDAPAVGAWSVAAVARTPLLCLT
jgi:hypothetical protein